MIEYKIRDPAFFIRSVNTISTILDESVIQFGGHIRMYGIDPSGICLYEFILGEGELDIISDEKVNIMVCLPDIQQIFDRFKGSSDLTLMYDNSMITMKGRINGIKTFTLGILDLDIPDDFTPKLADLELDSVFTIDMSDFLDMIKDAEINSEEYTIETIGDKLIITSWGKDGDTQSNTILDDETTSDEKCAYSVDYTKRILSTLGNDDGIVCFSKNMPLMIYNRLSVDSFIKWYLGPRVQ